MDVERLRITDFISITAGLKFRAESHGVTLKILPCSVHTLNGRA